MRRDVAGNPIAVGCYLSAPTTVALSVASNSAQLNTYTVYRLWSSVDAFFQWGPAGATASTASHPITAKLDILHTTDLVNTTIAAIVSGGTGTLFISEYQV